MSKHKNTVKGHNAERAYVKVFKDLGYSYCMTSRQGSRISDDAGIDLINIPLNVQIKAGYERGLNIKETIQYTKDRIAELFPPDAEQQKLPTIVIHVRDVKRGRRRGECDTLVYMSFDDFIKLSKLQKDGVDSNT